LATSQDYRAITIEPDAVVYCDIPYWGTKDYGVAFNHAEFLEWAATRDFPVYVSEYGIDDPRFEQVFEVSKRSMLAAKKANVCNMERVYWNKKYTRRGG
jgi:hypothetical protein